MAEGTISHPGAIDVEVLDGTRTVKVRKWKMRDRATLKPRITTLFQKVLSVDRQALNLGLAEVFMHAEDECAEIAKASIDMPSGLEFDDLYWEDLALIVQAIWTLNVSDPNGGGLMGKAGSLLAPMLSTRETENKPSGQDSVSSPDDGAPLPSDSSTN